MPREQFDQALQDLQDNLVFMGSMVSQAIREAVKALLAGDKDAAIDIISGDAAINARRFKLEDACLTLIATQQPMARDMRLLAGLLEISGELERMGDYAKGIGRITIYMNGAKPPFPVQYIPQMADIGLDMLSQALEAFLQRDVEAALRIPQRDDEVDALYNQLSSELIEILLEHPEKIECANYLLWAAHNLERFADRVTNICERTVYTVTGEFHEMDVDEFGLSGV